MKKTSETTIKLLGFAIAIAGLGITQLSNWIDDRRTEEIVRKEIDKALTEKEKEES
ncbi:MAG: hypothetical protein Q4C65_02620 [Eubacteriales bacterium]|nr:hypothetical protein [Eubacteriales bacterium]